MKEFNTTGACNPRKHYMVDISRKLDQIEKMVEQGKYFTINRPRQYGKTTTMFLLEKRLEKKDYLIIRMSFERFGDKIFKDEELFSKRFIKYMIDRLELKDNEKQANILKNKINEVNDLYTLSSTITEFVKQQNKKVLLFIDEVDKSSNNQLFLSFLGTLRDKYLLREQDEDYTFHSIILAGVHDVKNLKLKLRPEEERKFNSPWNIAVNYNVEMDFNPEEISTMLRDYRNDKNVEIDIKQIAEKIYYFTSGHPYLVSKLCEIIDEEILLERKEKHWSEKDIEKAVSLILTIDSVNFESLIKNLENDKKLYEFVESIILDGNIVPYNRNNELINKGKMYGILKNKDGFVKVHNRIYEQLIYDYMISNLKINELINRDVGFYNNINNFIDETGYLNFSKILLKFQQFIKEQYSEKDESFLERNGRLVFLAFVKPIINGRGFDFKEVQISQEKRLDVVITYLDRKYIIELKIWRGEKYHQKGLEQLADYLHKQNLDQGYLVVFNFNKNKKFQQEKLQKNGKNIFAVWV